MAEIDRQRGLRVRDLREAKAWTQRQLAHKLNVDQKSVHNWEAGKDINPTNLREFAELMEVTPEYVRYGDRGETPDVLSVVNGEAQLATELAAIRLQMATLSTQIKVLQQSLEQSPSTASAPTRTRRAK